MFDINIQFLNYLLSLIAVVLAVGAVYLVWTNEERRDQEIKDLRERINTLIRYNDNKKK